MKIKSKYLSYGEQFIRNSGASASRKNGVIPYLVAIGVEFALFFISWKLQGESGVLFGLIYILSALLLTLLFGSGPGTVAGILASLSVDYHYIRPVGSVLDTWESFAFLVISIALIQLMLALMRVLQLSLEHAQKEKAHAEEEVRIREEILAIVSHDLKNPLSVVRMTAGLLPGIQPMNEIERQKLKRHADLVGSAAQQMEELITSILDFAKIESGTFALEFKAEEPVPIVSNLVRSLEPLVESKKTTLAMRVDEPLPCVYCDRFRVTQVLSNLLGNAIKFTPAGGKISVAVCSKGDQVLFSVGDTGPGIAADKLPHVFERYWQARETANLGSGLGLSIAQGIVKAHHGSIWVESKEGEGAQFFFTLPTSKSSLTRI